MALSDMTFKFKLVALVPSLSLALGFCHPLTDWKSLEAASLIYICGTPVLFKVGGILVFGPLLLSRAFLLVLYGFNVYLVFEVSK